MSSCQRYGDLQISGLSKVERGRKELQTRTGMKAANPVEYMGFPT